MNEKGDAQPRALVYAAPRHAEIGAAGLGEGEALLRMEVSALSRGTERLVFEGRVPDCEHERMRGPFQEGDFPFPVKYGYSAVAEVVDGPEALLGRLVFVLHPHQTLFRVPAEACHPLPPGLPAARAALAANMETALNVIWDAGAAPGDRVAVIGAGLVGCLVARLAGRIPGTEVFLTDRIAAREAIAHELGVRFADPERLPAGCDVAINCSASAAGLAAGLDCLGPEGRLVEASWHGEGETPVPLGGAFHSRRLRMISSQVGHVPAERAPRWTPRRRLSAALRLLAEDAAADALITRKTPFDELPARLGELLDPEADVIAALVTYD